MSITISRGDNRFQYRICPSDPLRIERRANQHGARWYWYLRRDTPGETKRALLAIAKKNEHLKEER